MPSEFYKEKPEKCWEGDKKDWVYVEIPEEDYAGEPHPKISINHRDFFPGQKYFVPLVVAGDIQKMIREKEARDRQFASTKPQMKSVAKVNRAFGGSVEADI